MNYVERLLIDEGHAAERVENDYGYDLILVTYDENGHVERGYVFFQLKASENLHAAPDGQAYFFQMTIEDYNLWRDEPMPVFLILYDARARRACWVYVQKYFEEDTRREPRLNAKSVRIRMPLANRMSRRTIRYARGRKQGILDQVKGVIRHV